MLDCLLPQVHDTGEWPEQLGPDVGADPGRRPRPRRRRPRAGRRRPGRAPRRTRRGRPEHVRDRRVHERQRRSAPACCSRPCSSAPVERLVVASSMSIYGEGCYVGADGRARRGGRAHREQLAAGAWEPCGPRRARRSCRCRRTERKRPALASVYALSKYDQERMCLLLGAAYGIPTVALRFFNVYGPRAGAVQPVHRACSRSSPRACSTAAPPMIFEDGEQRRDFVSVHDVARACRLALRAEAAAGSAINVGSGRGHHRWPRSRSGCAAVARQPGAASPRSPASYRVGDIRHCFADIAHGPRAARLRAGGRPRRGHGGAGGVARRPPGRRRRRAGHAGAGRDGG